MLKTLGLMKMENEFFKKKYRQLIMSPEINTQKAV